MGAGLPANQPPLQTFSGGYVHVLKRAHSPEDLLIQSFQKMGYVRRDAHRLMVAALPPPTSWCRWPWAASP